MEDGKEGGKQTRAREKEREGGGESPGLGGRRAAEEMNSKRGYPRAIPLVSIAAAYRSDGIIAAGSSDLKFSHLCRESTAVHISSPGCLLRAVTVTDANAICAPFVPSRE